MNKLLQSGDVSQAVQLAKAAIVAVDHDKRIPKDKLKESRKAVSAQQIKSNCSPSAFSTAREGERFSVLYEQRWSLIR